MDRVRAQLSVGSGDVGIMTAWIQRASKPSLEAVIEKIMRYFHRVYRPTFLGDVAIEIGYSLAQTEEFFVECIDRGLIRKATPQEIRDIGGRADSNVYVLIGRADPRLAHRP